VTGARISSLALVPLRGFSVTPYHELVLLPFYYLLALVPEIKHITCSLCDFMASTVVRGESGPTPRHGSLDRRKGKEMSFTTFRFRFRGLLVLALLLLNLSTIQSITPSGGGGPTECHSPDAPVLAKEHDIKEGMGSWYDLHTARQRGTSQRNGEADNCTLTRLLIATSPAVGNGQSQEDEWLDGRDPLPVLMGLLNSNLHTIMDAVVRVIGTGAIMLAHAPCPPTAGVACALARRTSTPYPHHLREGVSQKGQTQGGSAKTDIPVEGHDFHRRVR
jgi:hypothetical protein